MDEVVAEADVVRAEVKVEAKPTIEVVAEVAATLFRQPQVLTPNQTQGGQAGLVTQIYPPSGPARSTGTGASPRTTAWSRVPALGNNILIRTEVETGTSP